MLNLYTMIVLEVVALMIFLVIMANTNDLLPRYKQRQFLLLFFSVILGILAEWSGSVTTRYGGEFRDIHIWTKMIELSVTPVVPLLCAEILMPPSDVSKKNKWFHLALIFHTGMEFLSALIGFIYYVDENGVFCHGPFYWIYLITYLCGSVYVLWVGYRVSRQYQNKNKIMLVLMLGFLLLGIAMNQADKSIKSAWLTVAIVVTLIYIFYNNMLQSVDERTMLLNYASYRNMLSRLRKPATIQLFDIDFFKTVNDKYGHVYGYQCLQTIGGIIRKVYGRYGKCYRLDNDEFCVILDLDSSLAELNERFLDAMQEYRKTDSRFPFISLGYAHYEPSKGNVQDAEQAAFSVMYHNKERNKIKYGPIPHSTNQEYKLSSEHVMAGKHKTASETLDISGLTDRAFTAFSSTSERSYIYLCNMSTGVSRWSAAAVEYFGLPGEYMYEAGKIWESCIHPQDRKMYHEDIEAVLTGRSQVHDLEYRVMNRLGEYVVCTCRGVVLKGNGTTEPDLFAGTIVNHGIVDDVDPVTNLHTSADFTKSIHRLIEERADACVIKVGIEHFRHINAMYGQEGGNQVLRLFGMEIQDLIGGKGRVFRLDGAKFALYLYDAGQDEARKFFHQLCNVAEHHIQINNLRIPLRIYGGAVRLDARHSYNEYIVRSSLIYAMEQSLENYRNELVFSEDIGQKTNIENIQLHTAVHRSAMEGCRNFFLCYQPIVSCSNGKIIGAEALLRWKQEPYGVISSDRFIPWLENDPAFMPVGNWILRQAIQETRPLRQADSEFILNVNITDAQLEYSGFREDVLHILADTGCPPENLCLELTERCRHMDPDFLAGELRFFRSRGITIALDDFGTGASSMMLLLQLPIDELKVDRFFIVNALTDQQSMALLENIIQISKQAGYRTCVEGIETKEQCELISSLEGDCYQGYYASKPVPIEEFLEFYHSK